MAFNQNQRYEVLMHFTGYNAREGITGGEYAAKSHDYEQHRL